MRYGFFVGILPIALLVGGLSLDGNLRNVVLDSSGGTIHSVSPSESPNTAQNLSLTTQSGTASSSGSNNSNQASVSTGLYGGSGQSTAKVVSTSTGGNNSSFSGTSTGTPLVASPTSVSQSLSPAVPLSADNFGLNVAEWDNEMNASSTIPAIRTLGTGLQRFPNNDAWSWKLNRSRNGSNNYGAWDSFTSPFSMLAWGNELRATDNQGIFNINYGMNSTWSGGQSISDVQDLTRYILNNHIPVKAMVVGSENYSGDTINLRANKSPEEYANVAKQMAIAIHQIDPNMMVGVNLTPGLNGDMSGSDMKWNETVLRTDAPYIQFVTFHVYPVDNSVSSSGLLNGLMTDIPKITSSIRQELLANAGKYAPGIQVWFTEFNLYSAPRPGTVESVGGTAMLESMLLARSLGVQQVDWWSLHGGAHALLPNGQVAQPEVQHAVNHYGTFALAGDGRQPEIGLNSLYATGQALSKLTSLIHGGAQLQVQRTNDLFIAKVTKGSQAHWILMNLSNTAQKVHIGQQSYTVSPTGYEIVTAPSNSAVQTAQQPSGPPAGSYVTGTSLSQQASNSAPPSVPHIASVSSSPIHSNELVTIQGSGFGSSRGAGYVSFSNNGVNWGSPQNFYKLTITKWTNTEVQFVTPSASVPNGSVNLKPGSTASMTVFAQGQEASNTFNVSVASALPAQISTTNVSPGQVLTVTGSGFGSSQGNGYVQFSDNNVNWGSPSNFYKLKVVSWKDNAVSFVVPTQNITPGTQVSVSVMGADGIQSVTVHGSMQ